MVSQSSGRRFFEDSMTEMGSGGDARQGPDARPVVAFDFDGTLTVKDSFTAFLAWRSTPLRYIRGLLALVPAALVYLIERDRGAIKAAAAREFLCGMGRDELKAEAERYCRAVFAQMIRPDAEQCWAEWKARGAVMTIVTASPEEVVAPFAARLGAEVLIGSRLAYDAGGRVVGTLEGPNCRGAEKVARLKRQFGPDMQLAAAYGDTSGDREMLAMARERGLRVFTAKPSP
jgi:phosphatidylglycerophosphatase C